MIKERKVLYAECDVCKRSWANGDNRIDYYELIEKGALVEDMKDCGWTIFEGDNKIMCAKCKNDLQVSPQ
jgi:hypothetical protein